VLAIESSWCSLLRSGYLGGGPRELRSISRARHSQTRPGERLDCSPILALRSERRGRRVRRSVRVRKSIHAEDLAGLDMTIRRVTRRSARIAWCFRSRGAALAVVEANVRLAAPLADKQSFRAVAVLELKRTSQPFSWATVLGLARRRRARPRVRGRSGFPLSTNRWRRSRCPGRRLRDRSHPGGHRP